MADSPLPLLVRHRTRFPSREEVRRLAARLACAALCVSFTAAILPATATAAASPVLERVDATGAVHRETLPAGSGLLQFSIDGRSTRTSVVDLEGPRRMLVEFDAPPILRASGGRVGPTPMARASQLQSDLARLVASASQAGGPPAVARVTREFHRVWSGAALLVSPRLIDAVRSLPYVVRVVPDDSVRATLAQSVPLIRADTLRFRTGASGAGVRVGIIDTGIDYTHAAFGGGFGPGHTVAGGYDFFNGDPDPIDDNGHGTHVAGIVAGHGGGVFGVAPGATLYAFKVLSAGGYGFDSTILAALEAALDPDGNPATDDAMQVVNLSLGSANVDPDAPLSIALDHLTEAGVVCCVAAGNSGGYRTIGSPGTSRRAITVGATDKSDQLAWFTSKGPVVRTDQMKPELMAPGVDIVSARMGGGTIALSGTSMATPHVTGCAALLLQLHPTWTPDEIKSALATTAHALPETELERGAGRVDALDAAFAGVSFTPAQLSFGRVPALRVSVWARAETLVVRNLGSSGVVNLALPASFTIMPGAVVHFTPAVASLAPGDSSSIVAELDLSLTAVPTPREQPFGFSGTVVATAAGKSYRIPVSFFRHSVLHIAANYEWTVVAESHDARDIAWFDSGPAEVALPAGSYDVTGISILPSRFVTRDEVFVGDSTGIAIDPSGASAVQSYAYTDARGMPFRGDRQNVRFRRAGSHWSLGAVGFPTDSIFTAPERPDYQIDWNLYRADWDTSYVSLADAQWGVHGSRVHTNPAGQSWHSFVMTFPAVDTSSAGLVVWDFHPFLQGGSYFGVGSPSGRVLTFPRDFSLDVMLPATPDPDQLGLGFELRPLFGDGRIDWSQGPILLSPSLRFDRGWPIPTFKADFFHLPSASFAGSRMRFFDGPPVWAAAFHDDGSYLQIGDEGAYYSTPHVFTDAYGALRREPDPPYTVTRGGATIASGVLVGAGSLLFSGTATILLPSAGPCDVHFHRDYTRSGIPGALDVLDHVNTLLPDADPPALGSFEIASQGQVADTADFGRGPVLASFRLRDAAAFTVQLQARSAWASGSWVSVPVVRDTDTYVGTFPEALDGPITVRLVAEDASGNATTLTWDPAFFAIPGGPPVRIGPDGRPLLTMQGAVPNPSRGRGITLEFVLPDASPAEVELLDLAGRRVTSQAVGIFGAGRHRVSLAGADLRPGIYFARLHRLGESRVARFVVLR